LPEATEVSSFKEWFKRWWPTYLERTVRGAALIVQHLIWISIVLGGIHLLGLFAQDTTFFGTFPVKYVLQMVDLVIILLFAAVIVLDLWTLTRGDK
jgi:hypothetical protein